MNTIKGLILRSPEVVELLEKGRVEVVRKMKPQPHPDWSPSHYSEIHKMDKNNCFPMRNGEPIVIGWGALNADGDAGFICPFGQPGEVRFVKETFRLDDGSGLSQGGVGSWSYHVVYKADLNQKDIEYTGHYKDDPYLRLFDILPDCFQSPAIMPQWASRLNTTMESCRVDQRDGVWQWVMSWVRK